MLSRPFYGASVTEEGTLGGWGVLLSGKFYLKFNIDLINI